MTTPLISVSKIAKLARLHQTVSPEYIKKYESELGSILEYVDQLSKAPLTMTLKKSRQSTIADLRADEVAFDHARSERIRANIIAQFPHKSNALLILPGIFAE
jgi:aspartyl/glutamyl-tRNA(Asn/Gln) amidotransferase C subunit